MNEFEEFNQLVNEYNEEADKLDMFAQDQEGMSVQGLSPKKFVGSGEDVVLGDIE